MTEHEVIITSIIFKRTNGCNRTFEVTRTFDFGHMRFTFDAGVFSSVHDWVKASVLQSTSL